MFGDPIFDRSLSLSIIYNRGLSSFAVFFNFCSMIFHDYLSANAYFVHINRGKQFFVVTNRETCQLQLIIVQNFTCMWNFMWNKCEKHVKKGVKNVILSFSHSVSHALSDKFTHQTWNTVWNGSYFHAVFIRFSHDNFTRMWHFTMWKACEKNVNDVKKVTFSKQCFTCSVREER